MKNLVKQIISFILPITVLVLVPLYIERDISIKDIYVFLIGLVIIGAGLYTMTRTISLFIKIGKGTLAPWSPTKKLVIFGMYQYVRNPMIMGVLTVLIGESIAIQSFCIMLWASIFYLGNTIYFILSEEPDLEKRFGETYRDYKKNVPRWIPRMTPYEPGT